MQWMVLGSAQSWYVADLRRAAASAHTIHTAGFMDLSCEVGREPRGESGPETGLGHLRLSAAGRDLSQFDGVLVRTMPPATLEQVVFRMDLLGQIGRRGTLVMNPARAIETAVDKLLTSCRVQEAGLPTPRTVCCQTRDEALAAYDRLGGDVVVKPLFGGEGRGLMRVSDPALMTRAAGTLAQLGSVFYLQRFIQHEGFDLRAFVLGDRVLSMRRRHPHDWRTNISRGARGEAVELEPALQDMARHAAQAVGAPMAGVDLLPGRDGKLYVLEVNAVPGWKALAEVLRVDVAALVLEFLEAQRRA
jgi:ribosomal protein S6--L-glutamate ligase